MYKRILAFNYMIIACQPFEATADTARWFYDVR